MDDLLVNIGSAIGGFVGCYVVSKVLQYFKDKESK